MHHQNCCMETKPDKYVLENETTDERPEYKPLQDDDILKNENDTSKHNYNNKNDKDTEKNIYLKTKRKIILTDSDKEQTSLYKVNKENLKYIDKYYKSHEKDLLSKFNRRESDMELNEGRPHNCIDDHNTQVPSSISMLFFKISTFLIIFRYIGKIIARNFKSKSWLNRYRKYYETVIFLAYSKYSYVLNTLNAMHNINKELNQNSLVNNKITNSLKSQKSVLSSHIFRDDEMVRNGRRKINETRYFGRNVRVNFALSSEMFAPWRIFLLLLTCTGNLINASHFQNVVLFTTKHLFSLIMNLDLSYVLSLFFVSLIGALISRKTKELSSGTFHKVNNIPCVRNVPTSEGNNIRNTKVDNTNLNTENKALDYQLRFKTNVESKVIYIQKNVSQHLPEDTKNTEPILDNHIPYTANNNKIKTSENRNLHNMTRNNSNNGNLLIDNEHSSCVSGLSSGHGSVIWGAESLYRTTLKFHNNKPVPGNSISMIRILSYFERLFLISDTASQTFLPKIPKRNIKDNKSIIGTLISMIGLLSCLARTSFPVNNTMSSLHMNGGAMGAIIPPPWANSTVNPCALESWQLIYWPQQNRCYRIFSQGPCSHGEEVYHDEETLSAMCRCEKGRIKHSETSSCYQAYTRGPCRPREYLQEVSPTAGEAMCTKFQACMAGHVFWPTDGDCHRQYTKGPCQQGDLIHLHPHTGWPTCGCDKRLMRMQHWPHTDTCHEHMSRGPCVTGHVFTYNTTTKITQCDCSPALSANYHRDTEQCYPLETQGPCPPGHIFSLPKGANEPMCTCLPGHLLHVPSGTCQRAYTRAVCLSGQFLQPDDHEGVGVGRCATVPCSSSGQLYNPETDRCYPVGSSGPCSKGKLWVYERASSLRGRCHCDEHLVGYWGPHDICYPLGKRGPCPSRHIVTYSSSRGLACSCDRRRGYTRWKGRCERITAADIIRDLMSNNAMDDPNDAHSNSVMRSRAMNFKQNPAPRRITNNSPIEQTTASTTTTRQQTVAPTTATTELPNKLDITTHQRITFSRNLPNSIEEMKSHRTEDNDIRKRIARLTHRGLITRRTRRPT